RGYTHGSVLLHPPWCALRRLRVWQSTRVRDGRAHWRIARRCNRGRFGDRADIYAVERFPAPARSGSLTHFMYRGRIDCTRSSLLECPPPSLLLLGSDSSGTPVGERQTNTPARDCAALRR